MKIIVLIILVLLNITTINADSDNPQYNINDEEEGTRNESSNYKVKSFYGTWIAVKLRWVYPCAYKEELPVDNIKHLGKKIIIKPNFYQNTMHEKNYLGDNAYMGKTDIFYSTEIFDYLRAYYGTGAIGVIGKEAYDTILIFNKEQGYHEKFGDYDILQIKDENTLIYTEDTFSSSIMSYPPQTLYMLVREEEAKKLDKYEVYVPTTKIEDEPGKFDYEKEELYYTGCSPKYDEYAKKLESEGKYKVIRDSKMARNFIDID